MIAEAAFRVAFWVLLAGVFVMRVYFALQVRRAGERVMPDRQAIDREGRAMFAFRVAMGLLLACWLALYAIYPTWMEVLLLPFPDWLRWAGFRLGDCQPWIVVVDSGCAWQGMVSPTTASRAASFGHHRALSSDTSSAVHGHVWILREPCPGDCELGLCGIRGGGDRGHVRTGSQGRADDDR